MDDQVAGVGTDGRKVSGDPTYDLGARETGQTVAGSLGGLTLPGGWKVGGKVDRRGGDGRVLSGCAFSVCYEATGPEGEPAIKSSYAPMTACMIGVAGRSKNLRLTSGSTQTTQGSTCVCCLARLAVT